MFRLCLLILFCAPVLSAATPQLTYLLQADAQPEHTIPYLTEQLGDWVILDTAIDGNTRWTKEQLQTIQSGKTGRKLFAYISIGEAESYRPYWQTSWHDTPPDFLLQENPDWKENYLVRYWHTAWQTLILQELQNIMEQGFDGIMIDKADSFENFEHDITTDQWIDHRINPETQQSYRKDMQDWLIIVCTTVRQHKPDATVILQNATQLLDKQSCRSVIDIAQLEDLFSNGKRLTRNNERKNRLADLTAFRAENKPVIVVEYCTQNTIISAVEQQARTNNIPILFTDRNLTSLGRMFIP